MKNSRSFRQMALGFLAALALAGCATLPSAGAGHYYVKRQCAERANCYVTVQAALDAAAQDHGDDWVVVDIDAGEFYEKVTVLRNKVRLRGQGVDQTHLVFDAVAQTAGSYHRNNWGTPGSATLTIDADQVDVEGLTIENRFDFLTNDARADGDPQKIGNSQAVAVLLDIHSDRVMFRHAALEGYQDTLFANGNRVLIRDSLVSGNVDFIFGNGQVLIEDSTVQSRRRAATFAAGEFQSFVVAPSTPLAQTIGIVVYRSRLTREAGVPDGAVALGRPWHPTTRFADGRYADPNAVGQASFIDCFIDSHIGPEHWTSMNGTARDGTKTAVFQPQDSRFSESGSYGPGARHADQRLTWQQTLSIADIHKLFFAGWPEAAASR